jgi:tetratricopeptide (TPR) repeat protein
VSTRQESRVFRASDGFNIARILEERDRYTELASDFGFSPMLGCRTSQAEVTFEFRRPFGDRLSELDELDEVAAAVILEAILRLEKVAVDVLEHLDPDEVYYLRSERRVVLHAPLIGWHIRDRGNAGSARWGKLLSHGAVTDLDVRSVQELAVELQASGFLPTEAEQSSEERWEALRSRVRYFLTRDPCRAVELSRDALRLSVDRDLVGWSLEASVAAKDATAFDEFLRLASSAGVATDVEGFNALRAWRSLVRRELDSARELAESAIKADSRVELALSVLVQLAAKQGDLRSALDLQIDLLDRFPSETNCLRALRIATKIADPPSILRVFDAYGQPLLQATALLVRARAEFATGAAERCMGTLLQVAESCPDVTEALFETALSTAEDACRALPPGVQCERLLHLLGAYRSALPASSEVALAMGAYLLRANDNRGFRDLVPSLPNDPRSANLRATLLFREGDDRSAVTEWNAALDGRVSSPEMIDSMIQSAQKLGDFTTIRRVLAECDTLLNQYPDLRNLARRALEETPND